MTTLMQIPIGSIIESPHNPRRRYDDATLRELAASIAQHGIVTPLLVRPTSGGRYELAAGHRRSRAAKIAELAEVPAIVRDMTDLELLEVLTIENLQREDIHPLDEAAGFVALCESGGYDVAAIAEKLGKSVSYVHRRMALTRVIPALQDRFLRGEINIGHALLCAGLNEAQQQEVEEHFAEQIEKGWAVDTVQRLGNFIANSIMCDLDEVPWSLTDAKLDKVAGACSACSKTSQAQADLFAEIELDSVRCLDAACFNGKHIAFRQQLVKIKKAKPLALMRHNKEWWPDGTIEMDGRKLMTANEGDPGAERYVVVAPFYGGELGEVRWLKPRSTESAAAGGDDDEEYEDEDFDGESDWQARARERKERAEANRARLFHLFTQRDTWSVKPTLLVVARALLADALNNGLIPSELYPFVGLTEDTEIAGDDEVVQQAVEGVTEFSALNILVVLAASIEIAGQSDDSILDALEAATNA